MGIAASICFGEGRSSRSLLGEHSGRERKILKDILAHCASSEDWLAVRNVSQRLKHAVDSFVALDLSIEWQLRGGKEGVQAENMVYGIYADLYFGDRHIVERYDEMEQLTWLWPTVPLRSIGVHCFYLNTHASNNDFSLHNTVLSNIATFLEAVPTRSLRNLKKFELATQDSFSSYFMCPEYTTPQFKRIVRRLPANMDSIEFQTFPSNEGLVGSLLGLKPKNLLILGDEHMLEDSLDMMKHNFETTLFLYLRDIENSDLLLKVFENLSEFSQSKELANATEHKLRSQAYKSCLHFPKSICKVEYKLTSLRGEHGEAALSLTVHEEGSQSRSSLRKISKEVRELNMLDKENDSIDEIILSYLPDYDSCLKLLPRNDEENDEECPHSPSCFHEIPLSPKYTSLNENQWLMAAAAIA